MNFNKQESVIFTLFKKRCNENQWFHLFLSIRDNFQVRVTLFNLIFLIKHKTKSEGFDENLNKFIF